MWNSFSDCDFQQVQSVRYTLDYFEPSDTFENNDYKFAHICNNWNMHGNLVTFLLNLLLAYNYACSLFYSTWVKCYQNSVKPTVHNNQLF